MPNYKHVKKPHKESDLKKVIQILKRQEKKMLESN